jgi:hypothetical protein
MQNTWLAYPKALTRLRKMNDSMRDAIGEDIEPRLRGMLQGHAEASFLGTSAPTESATGNSTRAKPRRTVLPDQPVR